MCVCVDVCLDVYVHKGFLFPNLICLFFFFGLTSIHNFLSSSGRLFRNSKVLGNDFHLLSGFILFFGEMLCIPEDSSPKRHSRGHAVQVPLTPPGDEAVLFSYFGNPRFCSKGLAKTWKVLLFFFF